MWNLHLLEIVVIFLSLSTFSHSTAEEGGQKYYNLRRFQSAEQWREAGGRNENAHVDISNLGSDPGGSHNPPLIPPLHIYPISAPTSPPTVAPLQHPTLSPTLSPTKEPTFTPTEVPTKIPTPVPTLSPTFAPSPEPSQVPSQGPTEHPTKYPTLQPTAQPSKVPTAPPSKYPTFAPTASPTLPVSAYIFDLSEIMIFVFLLVVMIWVFCSPDYDFFSYPTTSTERVAGELSLYLYRFADVVLQPFIYVISFFSRRRESYQSIPRRSNSGGAEWFMYSN